MDAKNTTERVRVNRSYVVTPYAQLNYALKHCLSIKPGPAPAIHSQRNSELIGNTTSRQLSSPVRNANTIQYGRHSGSLSFMLRSYAKNQLLCGAFNLSTSGSPRLQQEYADLN